MTVENKTKEHIVRFESLLSLRLGEQSDVYLKWLEVKKALTQHEQLVREVERTKSLKILHVTKENLMRYKCGKHKKLVKMIDKMYSVILKALNPTKHEK